MREVVRIVKYLIEFEHYLKKLSMRLISNFEKGLYSNIIQKLNIPGSSGNQRILFVYR